MRGFCTLGKPFLIPSALLGTLCTAVPSLTLHHSCLVTDHPPSGRAGVLCLHSSAQRGTAFWVHTTQGSANFFLKGQITLSALQSRTASAAAIQLCRRGAEAAPDRTSWCPCGRCRSTCTSRRWPEVAHGRKTREQK